MTTTEEPAADPQATSRAAVHDHEGAIGSADYLKDSGWFKAWRIHEALELIEASVNAFALLYIIALRCRWRNGFNAHGLTKGQAFLGDFESYGMTERGYRTAKRFLERHGFAAFKPTTKGTVATLANSRVFDVSARTSDGQHDRQAAIKRRTSDGQVATNEEGKKGNKVQEGKEDAG